MTTTTKTLCVAKMPVLGWFDFYPFKLRKLHTPTVSIHNKRTHLTATHLEEKCVYFFCWYFEEGFFFSLCYPFRPYLVDSRFPPSFFTFTLTVCVLVTLRLSLFVSYSLILNKSFSCFLVGHMKHTNDNQHTN